MFDIGFTELVLISVVALLILGPDKLPGFIRTMGLWIGRLRRNFDNIKKDIEKEIGADDIRRQLRNEAILEKFNESKKEITAGFGAVKEEASAVRDELNVKDQVKKAEENFNKPASQNNDGENSIGTQTPASGDADADQASTPSPEPAPGPESENAPDDTKDQQAR